MAPTSIPQISSFALRSILEKDKLNGTDFTNWYHNLRIVLKQEKKEHVLDSPIPDKPADEETATVRNAYSRTRSAEASGNLDGAITTVVGFGVKVNW